MVSELAFMLYVSVTYSLDAAFKARYFRGVSVKAEAQYPIRSTAFNGILSGDDLRGLRVIGAFLATRLQTPVDEVLQLSPSLPAVIDGDSVGHFGHRQYEAAFSAAMSYCADEMKKVS